MEAIESVANQSLKPDEIIVSVDHNEELYDLLNSMLSDHIIVIHNTGRRGFSATKNFGIRSSNSDIVVFLDDDALAGEYWLENITKHFHSSSYDSIFHENNVVAVGGQTFPQWEKGMKPNWFPDELLWIVGCTYEGMPVRNNEIRNIMGGNSSFQKSVFDVIGYFGTHLGRIGNIGVAEEADFCIKLKQSMPNSIIRYEPAAIIYHKVPLARSNINYLIQRARDEGASKRKLKKNIGNIKKIGLTTENTYIKTLIFSSIPRRLIHFYKKNNPLQICVIFIAIIAAGIGYLFGNKKQR